MSQPLVIRNLAPMLAGSHLIPTITRYNRLESRPYTSNFTRALRAEVRDALWMICKQWQMGEFGGSDAGSPVSAKLHVEGHLLSKYQPANGDVSDFDRTRPLETTVERRTIPFALGPQRLSLDLRLQMGRRWLKMIPSSAGGKFRTHYKIESPDPESKADAAICAHAEAHQQFSAVAGRAMDGATLYFHLKSSTSALASDGVSGLTPAEKSAADLAGPAFVEWFEHLYSIRSKDEGDAWQPERLEYRFACAAPDGAGGETVLTADGYAQGRLDWYSFDKDTSAATLGTIPGAPDVALDQQYVTRSFIPAPVRFNGMPDTRWWAFEDGKTNFGDIKPGTTELPKLLLIEFGLVYANDWFLLPYTVPAGSLLKVSGLAVTNTFGERFWIEAAGRGPDEAWQRWAMFSLSIKGDEDVPADLTLLVLPTVPKIQQGEPREVVALTRDEMANMVWGIETMVPLPTGRTRAGNVAAAEYQAHLQEILDATTSPPAPVTWKADVRYDIMSTVPEHWIPFVPEHVAGSNRQIQLRRAAMPRFYSDAPVATFERVRPRTTILSEGLADRKPYRIHEEEVSRAGTHVMQAFQRTRWNDGRVFTWLGAEKHTGRGEGHSGLAFDRLLPTGK